MQSSKVKKVLSDSVLLILLIALIILFSIMSDKFFTQINLTNILVQNVHVAVCSTAVLLLMVSGSVDLSVGYQVSCTAVLCTMMMSKFEINPVVSVIAALVLATGLSLLNGFLAKILQAHSMIVTLGTMAVFQGVSYLMSQSKTYYNLPNSFKFLGQGTIGPVPFNAILALIVIVIVGIIITKTWLGRFVYAVGDNPEAAKLVGIDVDKVKLMVSISAGVLIGLAAILLASRNGSADSTTGLGIEFTGITACVLAGTSLKGGSGKLWKVIVAVYVLGVLSNGMQLVGLGVYPQYIVKGAIMLVSIGLSARAGGKPMGI